MPLTAPQLADIHLDLLYERDNTGLMLGSRDPDVAAPLLHLVRTTESNRWFLSAALSEQQREELRVALEAEPVITDLAEMEARPPVLKGVRPLLAGVRLASREDRGPAFVFSDALPGAPKTAGILRDTRDTRTVPELTWIRDASPSEHPLAVARNDEGEVVAVCHACRSTPAAAEAGVETARDYRGRGLADAVVLCWASAVQEEGRIPVYSTSWANHASRAVARKLGLIMFGEDYSIG